MKALFTAIVFASLLAWPALAKPLHIRSATSNVTEYGETPLLDDWAASVRRSNLNPRDPAYVGGGGFVYSYGPDFGIESQR
jgi:hypothetical protein